MAHSPYFKFETPLDGGGGGGIDHKLDVKTVEECRILQTLLIK